MESKTLTKFLEYLVASETTIAVTGASTSSNTEIVKDIQSMNHRIGHGAIATFDNLNNSNGPICAMLSVAEKELLTVFTSTARTTEDLVLSMRNAKIFYEEKVKEAALTDVLSVIHVDVHLSHTTDGSEYIERVTEIVGTPGEGIGFECNDIFLYSGESLHLETASQISPSIRDRIAEKLPIGDRKAFTDFLDCSWK